MMSWYFAEAFFIFGDETDMKCHFNKIVFSTHHGWTAICSHSGRCSGAHLRWHVVQSGSIGRSPGSARQLPVHPCCVGQHTKCTRVWAWYSQGGPQTCSWGGEGRKEKEKSWWELREHSSSKSLKYQRIQAFILQKYHYHTIDWDYQ